MGYDAKLAELILYVSSRSEEDPTFGAIKLNKILFFADFLFFARHRRPITNQEYMALPMGPAPRHLVPVRAQLEEAQALAIQKRTVYGREQQRPIALREPDLSAFSGEEIAMVEYAISQLWGKTAAEVSELSHAFDGWKLAEEKETIPFETVFLSERPLTAAESEFARSLVED
jgi:uncharacterized phage-associated protein